MEKERTSVAGLRRFTMASRWSQLRGRCMSPSKNSSTAWDTGTPPCGCPDTTG